jgi:hypothetical protein
MPGAISRKDERCRIVAPPPGKKARMNSLLIEFVDGFLAVVSRNALRVFGPNPKARGRER